MLTSARNHFAGKVSRIKTGSVNDEIQIKLTGGERLVSIITHESVENLGLKVGRAVVALVKASSVIVAIDDGRAAASCPRAIISRVRSADWSKARSTPKS